MKKFIAVILGLILVMLSVTGCARPDPTYVTEEDFVDSFLKLCGKNAVEE